MRRFLMLLLAVAALFAAAIGAVAYSHLVVQPPGRVRAAG